MNNIVMCSSCYGETFEVWFYANSNDTSKFDTENIICYKCYSKKKRTEDNLPFVKYPSKDMKALLLILEDLTFKQSRKAKYPLYQKFCTEKYYVKSTVSEFFAKDPTGEFSAIQHDKTIFEDPKVLITDRMYLSRRSLVSSDNTFDSDALLYKIKRKQPKNDEQAVSKEE